MEMALWFKEEKQQHGLKQMELLAMESCKKEEHHLKLLGEYKALIDQAINSTQTSEAGDPKLLHIKITQLEKELHLAKAEK